MKNKAIFLKELKKLSRKYFPDFSVEKAFCDHHNLCISCPLNENYCGEDCVPNINDWIKETLKE